MIVIRGAPRWVLATVIGAALGVGLPPLVVAAALSPEPIAPSGASVQPAPSPSPSPSLTPEERAREAEREDLEEEAEEPPPRPAPVATPRPSPSPVPSPSASPVPAPSPSPSPVPSPSPSPSPAMEPPSPPALASPSPVPEAVPEPSAPSPEPSPPAEEPAPEESANLLEKLPTFQDIEDIDLTMLLKVTAGEEGTRTVDDEPGLVTVVSEEDIRRTGARTLQEVLQTVAGLEVLTDSLGRARIVVRGLPGAMSAGGSENVLVLLNGVRLNDSLFGGATTVNLDLPVDNVKRIEIVRGPGSVLYGPGALLAVINVVTESVDTFRRDELSVGGGSFKSFLYNFRYGTTFHDVSLAGFMQYSSTGGPELDVPTDVQTVVDRTLAPLGLPAASLAPGQTDDDRKALDANLTVAYRKLTFSARLKKENAGGFIGLLDALGRQNRFANTQSNLGLEYRRDLRTGDVRARVSYGESRVDRVFDVLPPGYTLLGAPRVVFPSGILLQQDLNSRRLGGEAVFERPLGPRHALTAGVAFERESTFGLRALTNYDFLHRRPLGGLMALPELVPEAERTVGSVYVQDAWNPTSRLGVTGGVRVERYSDAGSRVQPRVAAAYRFPRDLTLKAGYARGVRAPSFLERFYSSPAFRANPELGPTRVDSLDFTALLRRKDLRLSATAYRTWLRDPIAGGSLLFGLNFASGLEPIFLNQPGIDAHGVEVEASRSFAGNRSVALVYSWQQPEDRGTGAPLADVPRHLGRVSAHFGLGRYLLLSPSLTVRGARARAATDQRAELGAYSLVDVVARAHNFHPALELSAVVHDLFGREYFDPSPLGGLPGDYPRPGRSIFVKVKYRF